MARTTLAEQLAALGEAVDLARDRSDVAAAQAVVKNARGRLAQSNELTVVALAGSTGSGKSSLFNALSGTTLAETGVLRPTTSCPLGASFDTDATELFSWLEVGNCHQVRGLDPRLKGLVLLDLPDHDSTHSTHRAEVDRLVKSVDVMVWVTDPQKYADASLHHDYLRPLASHKDVLRVVLNQIDTLSPADVPRCVADIRRVLSTGGLKGVEIIAISAATGQGVGELRTHLAEVVKRKASATSRLRADLAKSAADLRKQLGETPKDMLTKAKVEQLTTTLASAAGVDTVVSAVADATKHRGVLATGWPFVKWLRRLRPDPLRRLRLAPIKDEHTSVRVQRTSLAKSAVVQEARVASAVRAIGREAAASLPDGWRDSVLKASRVNLPTLADQLDRAIATTDLGLDRPSPWWRVIQVLQWLLTFCVVVGFGWLLLNLVLSYFMLPPLPGVGIGAEGGLRLPLPSVLVIAGALLGVALAAVSRGLIALSAQAAANRARSALRRSVTQVAQAEIMGPVRAELERHAQAVRALQRVG